MKDELGEYIEIFELVGVYGNGHQTPVARATNPETFKKMAKRISISKHQDDRAHRIYRAYSDKMVEKYCQEIAGCSPKEFSDKVSAAFELNDNYYQEESDLRLLEKKIDEAVADSIDAMVDNHPLIFRTWDYENGFNYLEFDSFFSRISKAYSTFEVK